MRRSGCIGIVLLLSAVLQACADSPARRGDSPGFTPHGKLQQQAQASGLHIVKAGETLYSIAWVYGLDYHRLADWNDLDKDYRLSVGQKLRLTAGDDKKRQNNDENVKKATASAPKGRAASKTTPARNKHTPATNGTNKPPKGTTESIVDTTSSGLEKSEKSITESDAAGSSNRRLNWLWPAPGFLLGNYSADPTGNKGLNIAGKIGEPVRAAAPGRVVYAGNGLRGYGQLIILKHNEEFLSAYAHNSVLRVKENDIVKAGQVIADIGSSGTDRSQLHFEIRFQGLPVDPLKHLPKR